MKASVKVVGMRAGGREHVVAYVSMSDPVLLVHEPTNRFDANAVAVFTAPRGALRHPIVSSLNDPAGVGTISEEDRWLLLDRQAGYLPREFAARVWLPEQGIVGFVAEVRYPPKEYVEAGAAMVEAAPVPVGFDVCADFPMRD